MCNFEFLQVIIAFFSKTVWPRNMKFGLHRVSIWVNIQKKFQVPGSHSIGEKCDANLSKFQSKLLFIEKGTWMCIELWIFASYHRIFRGTKTYGLPRNMKFGLHRVSIWVNIQKKFQVPRLHSIGEKCDTIICKLSSHFSRKLCDRGTWNLVCIEYPYGLIYKKNFKFLGRTVLEKNAMLTCKISKLFIRANVQLWIFASYHRIFLENCVTEEHEIWFA